MKGTLWGGAGSLDRILDSYTVGEDRSWDQRLVRWDILGTIAHVEGLAEAGLLGKRERARLNAALRSALKLADAGEFEIGADDEDVHSALEKWLTAELGELGEKVHTGRSRNDQVLCDLRLFTKQGLLDASALLLEAVGALIDFAETHSHVVWPGFTHQRRAMPSSAGLWAGGFAELLLDDLVLIDAALELADRSPLGSAAGYGVPLPIDRSVAQKALGFASIQNNVTAVQSSRGKLEVTVLSALWHVGYDLAKLSWDVILFASEEFAFLELPRELATGSSIMPHKKNPDLFELTRARAGVLQGVLNEAMAVSGPLPSGYHRDLQLAKGPLIRGLECALEMLAMTAYAIPRLKVDEERAAQMLGGGLLATDEVFARVRAGQSFRSAYREVARQVDEGWQPEPATSRALLRARRGAGGAGKLGLGGLRASCATRARRLNTRRAAFEAAMSRLAGKRQRGGK
jgi:argininosuccinate lyase